MCADFPVQIAELHTNSSGFFKYHSHLNGTYQVDVQLKEQDCREQITFKIENSKPMRFYFITEDDITSNSNKCKNTSVFFLN